VQCCVYPRCGNKLGENPAVTIATKIKVSLCDLDFLTYYFVPVVTEFTIGNDCIIKASRG
jgi:hypothetical protein